VVNRNKRRRGMENLNETIDFSSGKYKVSF